MRLHLTSVLLTAAIGATLLAGPAAAAPDQARGVALMSASVAPSGTLISGAGAVSVTHPFTGVYRVVFVRSVEDCNFVASVGRTDGIKNPSGVASAWWDSNTDTVEVKTSDFEGTSADHLFQVMVFCSR